MTPIRLPATSQPLKWVPRASPHPRGLRVPPPRGVPRQTSNRGIDELDQRDRRHLVRVACVKFSNLVMVVWVVSVENLPCQSRP